MLLYFNKNGQLLEQLEYGSVPRVGMTTFSILAYFQDIDLSDYGAALIRFKRPDINGSEYPSLFMTRNPSFIYNSSVESSRYFKVQNNPYDIYTFNFNTVSDGDSGAIQTLLDTPGMWQASITLVNTSGGSNVTGLVKFMVEDSVSSADDDETNIDYDSIIHNVAVAMSSKLDKGDLQYIRYDGDFVSDATNGTLLKAIFVVGCHVFDNTTQDWYVINSVTDTTEGYVSATYSKISIVPNKQMTACVIINALTNINRRVLSNFEATHYNENWDASSGYEHYHITYGGEELTEAQAKSYMRHMCGSEHLPVYDYEYPQNSLFIMANGSFWKPQWGGGSGIHDGFNLIALPNPYALKSYVDTLIASYYTKTEANTLLSAKEDTSNKVTALSSASTDTQYPSAKVVYDNLVNVREVAEGKQDTLVSGTNIKTVNGTSLLGSGNIEIESGTKLYEHRLTLFAETYDSEELEFINMIIISTLPTEITDATTFKNVIEKGFIADQGNATYNGSGCSIIYNSYYGYAIIRSGTTPLFCAPINTVSSATDTVTEL